MEEQDKEKAPEAKPRENYGFGDFFECSDIDNQDYSEFMNDNSQIAIGEQSRRNTLQNNQEDQEEQEIDISEQLQKLKIAVGEEAKALEANENQEQPEDEGNPKIETLPNDLQLIPAKAEADQLQNSNAGSGRSGAGRDKKTKETMKLEPLPIFDCVFCVKDSKFIFQKLTEKHLSLAYGHAPKKYSNLQEQIEDEVMKIGKETDEGPPESSDLDYLQSTLQLEIMIDKLNIFRALDNVSVQELSPIKQVESQKFNFQGKESLALSQYLGKHILCPSITTEDNQIRSREIFLQLQLSRLNSLRQKGSSMNVGEGPQLTQPTMFGNLQTMYDYEIKHSEADNGAKNQPLHTGNFINLDDIMEEQYLGEGVNIKKWALTRRQRVVMDISYETEQHNIYSPNFTSRASSSLASEDEDRPELWVDEGRSHGGSSKEAAAFAEFISENSPKQIKGAISQSNFGNQVQMVTSGRETSSDLSVAEERDTISATAIAVTPNISRIMNICSISKIEQHSVLTVESNKNTPHSEQQSRSALSQPKAKKSVFKMGLPAPNSTYKLGHLVKDQIVVVPLEIVPGTILEREESIEEFKFGTQQKQVAQDIMTRNEGSKMSSFASHFKYQTAHSTKQSLVAQAHKSGGSKLKAGDKFFSFNKKDRKNYLAANNYTPQLLKPILNKQHPTTQKNLDVNYKSNYSNQNLGRQYNSQGGDGVGSSTTISYNKMSEAKNKINFEDQEVVKPPKKPSSQNLGDCSSLQNPYETLQSSPQVKDVHLGQGLKTSSIDIPNAFPTKEQRKEQSNKSPVKMSYPRQGLVKSSQQPLKNSQSLQNINLQPRVFITRNVKFRKQVVTNTGQNSARKTPTQGMIEMGPPTQQLLSIPSENLLPKPGKEKDAFLEKSPGTQLKAKASFEPQTEEQASKNNQRIQMKRQRLQRDILLSKVYNSNQSASSIPFYNTHKKNYSSIHQSQIASHTPLISQGNPEGVGTLSSTSFQKAVSKKGFKNSQFNYKKQHLKIDGNLGDVHRSNEVKNIQFYSKYLDGIMMRTNQGASQQTIKQSTTQKEIPVAINNFV